MAITERVSHEDLILYEIMRHPVLLFEFVRTLDIPEWDTETEFYFSDYQKEYLCDFSNYVSFCCGRSVGKTEALVSLLLWMLVNNLFPNEFILYTVPSKVHLEPVFTRLVRLFRSNELLQHFVEPRRGINSGNFSIQLLNNASLLCRIAGMSGTGANVVGLHTPVIILDEAGYYPWNTWLELQPVLNTFTTGFKQMVSGVPSGMREENVLYYADEVDDRFSRHRTSAHDNPRYSDEDEKRNLVQYGGNDTEEYIHFVLGRHGSPVFAVFDRRLLEIKSYSVYKSKINGLKMDTLGEYINRLAVIPTIPKNDFVFMGIDLGYTDPTSIMVMYEKDGVIKEHARIEFIKVKYPIQEKLIDYLSDRFGPEIIGVDAGHAGKSVVQHLKMDDIYLGKKYEQRIYGVEFGSWLVLGQDAQGEDIKVRLKPFSVSLLQEYSNSKRIHYSTTDPELVTELERMTYTKSPRGDIVYKTLTPRGGTRGADHNTAALLCATLVYYLLKDNRMFAPKPKVLLGSRWLHRG